MGLSNTNKRKKAYQRKKEKKKRLNRFETRLSMVAKFPDTSRHRDQGRAESRQKRVAVGEEGRGERRKG